MVGSFVALFMPINIHTLFSIFFPIKSNGGGKEGGNLACFALLFFKGCFGGW